MKVSGFAVTRIPSKNFYDGNESLKPYCFNGNYYGGYYREKWLEVDSCYWKNKLPEEILEIYFPLVENWDKYINLRLSKDLTISKVLLDFSNKKEANNEIMAVVTDIFEQPDIEVDEADLIFRGYDAISENGGARIDLGLFFKPELFEVFTNEINNYGLFSTEQICQNYISHYREIVKTTKGTQIEDCGAYEDDIIKPALIFSVKNSIS